MSSKRVDPRVRAKERRKRERDGLVAMQAYRMVTAFMMAACRERGHAVTVHSLPSLKPADPVLTALLDLHRRLAGEALECAMEGRRPAWLSFEPPSEGVSK